jgi:hypothetical protein
VQAVLPLDGGEVGDGVLVLVAPGNQRGLGDIEFGGNTGEYPALNAQLLVVIMLVIQSAQLLDKSTRLKLMIIMEMAALIL